VAKNTGALPQDCHGTEKSLCHHSAICFTVFRCYLRCDDSRCYALRYRNNSAVPWRHPHKPEPAGGYRACIQCVCLSFEDYHLQFPCLPDVVQRLDHKALPYVIFLVVPVLGRMSDPDDDIRATATNTFASLVKMVPLEVRRCCYTDVGFI
jgi:hypothetical protein